MSSAARQIIHCYSCWWQVLSGCLVAKGSCNVKYPKILFSLTEHSALVCSPSILGCSPSVPNIAGLYEQISNGRIDFISFLAWLFIWTLNRVKAPNIHSFISPHEWKWWDSKQQPKPELDREGRRQEMSSLEFAPALVGGFMAPAVPWYLQRALKLHWREKCSTLQQSLQAPVSPVIQN